VPRLLSSCGRLIDSRRDEFVLSGDANRQSSPTSEAQAPRDPARDGDLAFAGEGGCPTAAHARPSFLGLAWRARLPAVCSVMVGRSAEMVRWPLHISSAARSPGRTPMESRKRLGMVNWPLAERRAMCGDAVAFIPGQPPPLRRARPWLSQPTIEAGPITCQ